MLCFESWKRDIIHFFVSILRLTEISINLSFLVSFNRFHTNP